MRRPLLLVLVTVLLVLAAHPAEPATCCCTGKPLPSPFAGDGCPLSCCMKRAPSPVAAQADHRPVVVPPGESSGRCAAAVREGSPPQTPAHRDVVDVRAPLQRRSLSRLSILRL